MTTGRPLSERESSLLENVRGQTKIKAEIIQLEARTKRAYRGPTAAQRLVDLKAELSVLQDAMNESN